MRLLFVFPVDPNPNRVANIILVNLVHQGDLVIATLNERSILLGPSLTSLLRIAHTSQGAVPLELSRHYLSGPLETWYGLLLRRLTISLRLGDLLYLV